jgi:hypothetical protein
LQRCKAVLDGLIVQMAKPVVTSPVHSLRLCRKALVVSRARHRHHRLPFFGGGRAGGSSLPRSTLRLFVLTGEQLITIAVSTSISDALMFQESFSPLQTF